MISLLTLVFILSIIFYHFHCLDRVANNISNVHSTLLRIEELLDKTEENWDYR